MIVLLCRVPNDFASEAKRASEMTQDDNVDDDADLGDDDLDEAVAGEALNSAGAGGVEGGGRSRGGKRSKTKGKIRRLILLGLLKVI
jgi:hypothetical protein